MSYVTDEGIIIDKRPQKRRKLSIEPSGSGPQFNLANPSSKQIMLEEIDLEILLRQRLVDTVRSRLTWALLLQESVKRTAIGDNDSDMKIAALEALDAIEDPCDVLFTREIRPLKPIQPTQLPPAVNGNALAVEPMRPAYTTSTRTRGLNRTVRAPPKKLLFLRNNTVAPPQIAKLACPDCSRSDFSSLQGLLNHCRLRHQREYGSHDECVQSCAVLVEGDEEQAWFVANGTEVAGISLPGLRRLFEIAVGGSRNLLSLPALPSQAIIKTEKLTATSLIATTTPIETTSAPSPTPTATYLSRTLGIHEDTPALAQFLGKEPKRRVINTYDEDVDIFSRTDPRVSSKANVWKMHFAHRSEARSMLLQSTVTSSTPEHDDEKPVGQEMTGEPDVSREMSSTPNPLMQGTGTRFHISARVVIEDRSLWIPPEKRSKLYPEHTHRWRLTVSSPSYSLPLNTFLSKLTISCASDPPPTSLVEPITLDGSPFVVTKTTDRPFLASLTFHWADREDLNPPFTIEHWVELDPLHLSTSVAGDEQVFDVELDRNTELLPGREDQKPVTWEIQEIADGNDGDQETKIKDEDQKGGNPVPQHVMRLKTLLPQFPMTLRDVKGRAPKHVPYHLVAAPAQFRNLTYGRRKAIEWSRARALHEAYGQTKEQDADDHVALTVSDVYLWLENEGHFPREAVKMKISAESKKSIRKAAILDSNKPTELYCRRCGLYYLLHPLSKDAHPNVKQEAVAIKQEPGSFATFPVENYHLEACMVFNGDPITFSRPVFDVRSFIQDSVQMKDEGVCIPSRKAAEYLSPASSSTYVNGPETPPLSSDLLSVANPKLVEAIHRLSASWKLGHLQDLEPHNPPPKTLCLRMLERSRAELGEEFASSALLSLLTKCVTKVLVQSGIETFRKDEKALRNIEKPRMRSIEQIVVRRLLTPSHVLRGLQQPESLQNRDSVGLHTLTRIVLGTLGMSTAA